MTFRTWVRHPLREFKKWRARKRVKDASDETRRKLPLREFIYLDAVSLHSLLVSQNATIPDEVSQAISRADEAELTGTVGAKAGSDILGGSVSAETAARYQTSNSNSTQSSRKAVIQTLFKELRELPLEFKLATRDQAPDKLKSAASLATSEDPKVAEPASNFSRGTLVEVEVTLSVDPVFKLGAMMAEWNAMADDLPGMFGDQGVLQFLRGSQPIMKVLDRFLAGLIPIRAEATNHVVVEMDGREYIAHKTAIEGLDLKTRPLHIVGVTEHVGYWKDVRRVLFSDARFTILARVARDGLYENWTPVKLADLFSEVAPDFVDHINAIRSPSAGDPSSSPLQPQQEALGDALTSYKDAVIPEGATWDAAAEAEFQNLRTALMFGPTDAVAQRAAFDRVRDTVTQVLGAEPPSSAVDLAARQEARRQTGLTLFPSEFALPSSSTPTPVENEQAQEREERLLDTEVIAIYW